MTETIIHIVSGEVVLNPKPEPMEFMFTESKFGGPVWNTDKFNKVHAEWEKNCKIAENAERWLNPPDKQIIVHFGNDPYSIITPGQKVLADNNKVIKIL